jgi:hypothetical protein
VPLSLRYPLSVPFDGQPTPARLGAPGEVPGLYLDLGHCEHLIAGDPNSRLSELQTKGNALMGRLSDFSAQDRQSLGLPTIADRSALPAGTRSTPNPPVQLASLEVAGSLGEWRGAAPQPQLPKEH